MHFLGFAGMPRRIPDYPSAYADWNFIASCGTFLTISSMVFFFMSITYSLLNRVSSKTYARGVEYPRNLSIASATFW